MKILGISAFYHDSAACLTFDSNIVAAAQEERFTRIKQDDNFPINSIKFCLSEGKITLDQLDQIIFYEKPFLKFERLIENYLSSAPFGFKVFKKTLPVWIKNKIFQKQIIIKELKKINNNKNIKDKIRFAEHHESHAASAFFPSNFKSAAIVTIDGVGEHTTTSIGYGKDNHLTIKKEIIFPHSLGLLYSAFTYFLGFKVNSAEYKVMGLAPYGEPIYEKIILQRMIDLKEDGSFRLNKNYFGYTHSFKMINEKKFYEIFKIKKRDSNNKLEKIHMDIAASIQKITNTIVLKIIMEAKKITNEDNLVMAGGVALNCVSNGFIEKKKIFKNIWIQPASGDAGGSLGACLLSYYKYSKNKRIVIDDKDEMQGSYLGPNFSNLDIEKTLLQKKIIFKKILDENELMKIIANELDRQNTVGWFSGRMEFGPRSLGNRSIICDPRSEKMQSNLNLKIKFREDFRPFAPSIIEEDFDNWFESSPKNPYMLFVTDVKKEHLSNRNNNETGFDLLKLKRSKIPAVTHVDNSARYQVVYKSINPKFHKLISEFKEISGCPILINTSFNVRGEPIVCTPTDAIECFFGTNLDILVLENFIIFKNKNLNLSNTEFKDKFELD